VIVVEGARAVGKTTLVRSLCEQVDGTYLDLLDHSILETLKRDAYGFFTSRLNNLPIVVDEAQLIDSLTVDVKRFVDERSDPGQVILTGSSRIGRGALGGSDPLAGRGSWVTMNPLTVGERRGNQKNFLEKLITDNPQTSMIADDVDVKQIIFQGGLPDVSIRSSSLANNDLWEMISEIMPGYLESCLSLMFGKYDADRHMLTKTLQYLAANPAQIVNQSRIASELEINRETVNRYLEMLEDSLLLKLLPSLRPNSHKTLTAHPKLMVFDTAFAAWAASLPPEKLILSPNIWGGLIENLVALEIATQISWLSSSYKVGYWRQGKKEVDFIVQDLEQKVTGFEVKAAKKVNEADAKGLKSMRDTFADRFNIGYLVYTGNTMHEITEGIWTLPISKLWS